MLRLERSAKIIIRGLKTRELVYSEFGDPAKVIQIVEKDLGNLPSGQVHVKWLAAPVNPADLNQIQGVYPLKPPMPAVGGSEGFGRVEKVGSNVSGLKEGDHVIFARSGLGSWRCDGYHKPEDLFGVPGDLSLEASASFQVNPPTAYRMLHDFVKLNPGDTVIQNGSTSAVGRAVIQICKILGVKTVNLVRKRDDMQPIIEDLTNLGADLVITEEQLLKEYRKEIKNTKLALNCVGGRSTMFLANTLGYGGYLVTYGGMSKQPLQIPTGPFIFQNIHLTGFWMSRWYDDTNNIEERKKMYDRLGAWMRDGQLAHPKFQRRNINEHTEALEAATNFIHKQIFIF